MSFTNRRRPWVIVALVGLLLIAAGVVGARSLAGRAPAEDGGASVAAPPVLPVQRPPPCESGLTVRPADNLRRLVASHPAGTTFCLAAGVHHVDRLTPKDRQRFIGAGDRTVLSGARVLRAADARRDGDRWYWTGQFQSSEPHGELIPARYRQRNEGDAYNEELFSTPPGALAEGPRRLRRATSLGELGGGRWYLDDDSDRIYVADDPRRLGLIETSVAPTAITAVQPARARGVTIENLVV
jgi:hypothetical protein